MHNRMHVNGQIQFQRADRHLKTHSWNPNMNLSYGKVILRKQILLLGVNYMGTMLYFGYQIVEYKVVRKYPTPKNNPPNKEKIKNILLYATSLILFLSLFFISSFSYHIYPLNVFPLTNFFINL